MTISTLLTRSLFTAFLLPLGMPNILLAQVTPTNDGTGTVVNTNGNQFNIEGGTLSGNGANLFHSLEKLGLNRDQIANFLANPQVQNILTRVVGGDASIINGLIQVAGGNANLYLMNPAGVIFGPNAMINVPGDFVVTTATGIGFGNDQWFNAVGSNDYQTLVGNPSQFAFDLANPGAIFNGGNLTVGEGKNISLIGGTVMNTGTISAPGGDIAIAAIPGTSRVKISKAGNLVSLEVELSPNPDKSKKINPLDLPTLLTEGAIFLENTETNLAQGSVITEGVISAAGTQGGQVALIGQQVSVSKVLIDVSGSNGGGTVRVGGDYQGKGSIPNATTTLVDGKSQIKADGLGQGDGGRVIVWADGNTQFDGKISAKGGLLGGDGGFVETSGKNQLKVGNTALVNTSSPQGNMGTWLLDPTDLTVVASGGTGTIDGSGNNSSADSSIDSSTIVAALNSTNVNLEASNSITVNQEIDASTNTNAGNLTLQAPTVNLNQPISLNGQLLGSQLLTIPTTIVNVGKDGLIQNGVDVVASGGTVNLAEATYTLSQEVSITKSLTLNGQGADKTTVSGHDATRVFNISNISGTGINITLDGLTITKGNGGIDNGGIDNGGGIFVNSGSTLTLNKSTLSNNWTYFDGGGIYNNGGTVEINRSTLSSNSPTNGGGIYNNGGTLRINNSTLSSNFATNNGGGIFNNGGTVTVSNSTLANNGATDAIGQGGGIYNNGGAVTISNSTLSNNWASSDGGGIYSTNGGFTIENSTLFKNSATNGGAIALLSQGTDVNITNSTLSENTATSSGGGIYNDSSNVIISNSTITANNADNGGGGIYTTASNTSGANGGIITIRNSILAGNTLALGSEQATDSNSAEIFIDSSSGGRLDTEGNNLYGQYGYSGGFIPTNNSGQNTALPGSINNFITKLGDYGGLTHTHALLPGNPAINAAGAGATTTDQRGVSCYISKWHVIKIAKKG